MKTHLDHLALEYDLLYADLEEDIPLLPRDKRIRFQARWLTRKDLT